jgi:hypothetical protein
MIVTDGQFSRQIHPQPIVRKKDQSIFFVVAPLRCAPACGSLGFMIATAYPAIRLRSLGSLASGWPNFCRALRRWFLETETLSWLPVAFSRAARKFEDLPESAPRNERVPIIRKLLFIPGRGISAFQCHLTDSLCHFSPCLRVFLGNVTGSHGTLSQKCSREPRRSFTLENAAPQGAAEGSPVRSRVLQSRMRDKGWVGGVSGQIHTAVGRSGAQGRSDTKETCANLWPSTTPW